VLRYAVEIVELDPKGAPLPATARTAQFLLDPTPPDGEHQWAKVKPERPLEKDKSYRLSTLPQYPDAANQRSIAFEVSTYEFDTKASVSVVVPYAGGPQQVFQRQDGRLCFLLSSKVALDPASLAAGTIAEDLPPLHRPLDAEVPFELYKEDVPSSDQIGLAFIWISPPGPKSLDTHLTIAGVRNIFGAQVVVAAKERLKLAGAPKDKASSDLYVQLLSQAGPGSKPGWVADIKFSPDLAHLGHGVFFSPLVLADIGLNTVQGNKFTNMIQTGLGVTKFVPTGWNPLPGIQLTPRALLETDRFGYHRNVLFDGDMQWFGKGWLHSIKDRNSRIYAQAAFEASQKNQKPPDTNTLPQAKWGWQVQAFLGTEIGGQMSADTVKSSDSKTNVVLPNYNIARLRPKLAATLEFGHLALAATVTPRYLFMAENVTRQRQIPDPKNASAQIWQIYLSQARGPRAYGEASISWQFDEAGHYALSVNYKLGSVPPNFDYVNTVQTGITVKF
jgi:hypothetical protein